MFLYHRVRNVRDVMSNRTTDHNGFMTIENCILTSESVDDYAGEEIPNFQALGLNPNEVYSVYRPLDEIEKAKDEWNNKQLIPIHIRTNADDSRKDIQIGVVGNDAIIRDGKLYNTIVLHDGDAINNLDSTKDLSIGYDYTPVLENGVFEDNPYQIRMVNIKGNHLALVDEGRNQDAIVADSKNKFINKTGVHKMGINRIFKSFSFKKGVVGDSALTADAVLDMVEAGIEPSDIRNKINEEISLENETPSTGDETQVEKTDEANGDVMKQILAELKKLNSASKTTNDEDHGMNGDEEDNKPTGDDENDMTGDEETVGDSAIAIAKRLGGRGKVVGDSKSANKFILSALNEMGYSTKGKSTAGLCGMAEVALKHKATSVNYGVTGDSKSKSVAGDLNKMGF